MASEGLPLGEQEGCVGRGHRLQGPGASHADRGRAQVAVERCEAGRRRDRRWLAGQGLVGGQRAQLEVVVHGDVRRQHLQVQVLDGLDTHNVPARRLGSGLGLCEQEGWTMGGSAKDSRLTCSEFP